MTTFSCPLPAWLQPSRNQGSCLLLVSIVCNLSPSTPLRWGPSPPTQAWPPDTLTNGSSQPTFLGNHPFVCILFWVSKKPRRKHEVIRPHVYTQLQRSWAAGPVYYLKMGVWFSLSLHLICLPFIRWAPGLSLHHINSAGMYTMPAIWRGLTCVEYIYSILRFWRSLTRVIYGASVGGWRSSHLAFHNA